MKRGSGKRALVLAVAGAVMLAAGLGLGLDANADDEAAVTMHVVQSGETLWDIARPLADEAGVDIREVIYEIQVNNGLGKNPTLQPGQVLRINH